MSPSLSICIATMNRADYLPETLESILSQAPPELELVIVDGSKDNQTEKIVNEVRKKHSLIRYEKRAPSGVDRDYDRTVELASSDYVWLFSDDDILKEGVIAKVYHFLNKNYDLIVVNAEVCDVTMKKVIDPNLCKLDADRIFSVKDDDALFSLVANYLSFIGGVVFKRSEWNSRDRQTYYGTEFIHVGVIFQKPLLNGALVLADPLIRIRYGNAQWSNRMFKIWHFNWPQLIWGLPLGDDKAKQNICHHEPWKRPQSLFFLRALGKYHYDLYNEWIQPRLVWGVSRYLAFLISIFPVSFARFLCRMILKRKPCAATIRYELGIL